MTRVNCDTQLATLHKTPRQGRPAHPPTQPHIVDDVLHWYDECARDLPWRRPGTTPWAILVSEIMLQQTPVQRVLPVYELWLDRWPTPAALAAEPSGEAVRAWSRLGYPRRALRLHQCAVAITEQYAGDLPTSVPELLTLPGVGAYTARAVAAFAFGQREPVVDVNVRRLWARAVSGLPDAGASTTRADFALMESLLPEEPARASRFCAAAMEVGALVCTANTPRCLQCPLQTICAWRAAGQPDVNRPARRVQTYAGTDRQVRGRILAILRDSAHPVTPEALVDAWHLTDQRERALSSLLADGLIEQHPDNTYALPGHVLFDR